MPIFLKTYFFYSHQNKKLYFNFLLIKIIVFGGYVEFEKGGLILHYSSKKAFIIKIKDLLGVNKSVKSLKDFHILSLSLAMDLGCKDKINSIVFGYVYVWHNDIICNLINYYKPYIKLKNEINIYDDKRFNLFLKGVVVFNLFSIILYILKKSFWRMLYAIKQK